MTDQEKTIALLKKEVALWKNRTVYACLEACFHCEEYNPDKKCKACRIQIIKDASVDGADERREV